jgi:hypothetical protein
MWGRVHTEVHQFKYLINSNATDSNEYKIKLKQVESDWGTYCNIILGREISEQDKESAVYKNYMFFVEKLSEEKQKKLPETCRAYREWVKPVLSCYRSA